MKRLCVLATAISLVGGLSLQEASGTAVSSSKEYDAAISSSAADNQSFEDDNVAIIGNVACTVSPFDAASEIPTYRGSGFGTPEISPAAAADEAFFQAECVSPDSEGFTMSVDYGFEYWNQEGSWSPISDASFTCGPVSSSSASTAEVASIKIPGNPGTCEHRKVLAQGDPVVGRPHRLHLLLTTSAGNRLEGVSVPWVFSDPAAGGSDEVTLSLVTPGGAMDNATVAIFLEPFDPPQTYVPTPIFSGKTNADGEISFTPSTNGVLVAEAAKGYSKRGSSSDGSQIEGPGAPSLGGALEDITVNAKVYAIDDDLEHGVSWYLPLPMFGGLEQTIESNFTMDMSPEEVQAMRTSGDDPLIIGGPVRCELADDPDPDLVEDVTEIDENAPVPPEESPVDIEGAAQCSTEGVSPSMSRFDNSGVDKKVTRQVKLLQQHLAAGFNGSFCYLDGKNTTTDVAVKIGGGSWHIGGSMGEMKDRENGTCIPNQGVFRRVRYGEYRFYRYHNYYTFCSSPYGPCYPREEWVWKPHHWTGEIYRISGHIDPPTRDAAHSIRTSKGQVWWKQVKKSKWIGGSFTLAGLTLGSRSGYSGITKLSYKNVGRCDHNWIWAQGEWPAPAENRWIYTSSSGC